MVSNTLRLFREFPFHSGCKSRRQRRQLQSEAWQMRTHTFCFCLQQPGFYLKQLASFFQGPFVSPQLYFICCKVPGFPTIDDDIPSLHPPTNSGEQSLLKLAIVIIFKDGFIVHRFIGVYLSYIIITTSMTINSTVC